jgi:hypothetical protein
MAANIANRANDKFPNLESVVARSVKDGANQEPGFLNPAWVEALMGFPPGWTELGKTESPE